MADLFSLAGRVALVTGASSGLGRHFAGTLAGAGATVIVTARRLDRLAEVVAEIEAAGGRAHAVALDVTDGASVAAAFEAAAAGAGLPDVVVANAGIAIERPVLEQTEADWDAVIDTNLKGCWLVAQEAARRWVAAGRGGAIVTVGSILGVRVAGGVAPYAASKAGLIQLTKAMALELARHDIRVNALLPGWIVTDLNRGFLESEAGDRLRRRVPMRRFGRPEDLDGPLLLLSGPAGRGMTGTCVTVDHGHTISAL